MSAAKKSYLAFVPQHAPDTHGVLAIVDGGDGPEAEALVSLPDAPSATVLASALNGVLLHQVTAERHLEVVLGGASASARKTISALLPVLASATEDSAASRVARQLPTAGDGGFLLFPTTNCPGRCEFCGTCRDDCVECPECADGGCEICLPVTLTPRTAAVLGHALAGLAARRQALGYTQETLAQKLGVEHSTVGRWERGVHGPLPWQGPDLAEALNVSVDGLDVLLTRAVSDGAAVVQGVSATGEAGTVSEHEAGRAEAGPFTAEAIPASRSTPVGQFIDAPTTCLA